MEIKNWDDFDKVVKRIDILTKVAIVLCIGAIILHILNILLKADII